jgi:hypothetical protein
MTGTRSSENPGVTSHVPASSSGLRQLHKEEMI